MDSRRGWKALKMPAGPAIPRNVNTLSVKMCRDFYRWQSRNWKKIHLTLERLQNM